MSTTLDEITYNKKVIPNIECNLDIGELKQIKRYITEPYGASVVALTAIDKKNEGLELKICFDSNLELSRFVSSLVEIWRKYQPMKTHIRSYKSNGVFMNNLDDKPLTDITRRPITYSEFDGYDVIMDMESTKTSYMFNLYEFGEKKRRTIMCELNSVPDIFS